LTDKNFDLEQELEHHKIWMKEQEQSVRNKVIRDAQIIVSTLYYTASEQMDIVRGTIDYLIIDEANQASET
jgi:superfamily I DNA and/or RNA helicase